MNDILFYILIAFLIYFVFFHKKATEHFIDTQHNDKKNNKECSNLAINSSIYDYTTYNTHLLTQTS